MRFRVRRPRPESRRTSPRSRVLLPSWRRSFATSSPAPITTRFWRSNEKRRRTRQAELSRAGRRSSSRSSRASRRLRRRHEVAARGRVHRAHVGVHGARQSERSRDVRSEAAEAGSMIGWLLRHDRVRSTRRVRVHPGQRRNPHRRRRRLRCRSPRRHRRRRRRPVEQLRPVPLRPPLPKLDRPPIPPGPPTPPPWSGLRHRRPRARPAAHAAGPPLTAEQLFEHGLAYARAAIRARDTGIPARSRARAGRRANARRARERAGMPQGSTRVAEAELTGPPSSNRIRPSSTSSWRWSIRVRPASRSTDPLQPSPDARSVERDRAPRPRRTDVESDEGFGFLRRVFPPKVSELLHRDQLVARRDDSRRRVRRLSRHALRDLTARRIAAFEYGPRRSKAGANSARTCGRSSTTPCGSHVVVVA